MKFNKKLSSLISILICITLILSLSACKSKDSVKAQVNFNNITDELSSNIQETSDNISSGDNQTPTDDSTAVKPDSPQQTTTAPATTKPSAKPEAKPDAKQPSTAKPAPAAPAPAPGMISAIDYLNITASTKNDITALYNGLAGKQTNINLSGQLNQKQLEEIVYDLRNTVTADCNPMDNHFTYSLDQSGAIRSVIVKYSLNAQQQNELNAKVTQILAGMPSTSQFDKILYIHDYIINICRYDGTSDSNGPKYSTAYDVLVKGRGVCEGYAKAFDILCERAGIDAICVCGRAGGGSHMWNMVRCDGQWYNIDVTWDDPVCPAGENLKRYDYMNITDEQIRKTHTFDNYSFFRRPVATATAANYYVKQGTIIKSGSVEAIEAAFKPLAQKCIKNNGGQIVLKFNDYSAMEAARIYLIDNKNYYSLMNSYAQALGSQNRYNSLSYQMDAQNFSLTINV